MPLDIRKSLTYPFRKENFLNTVLFPSMVSLIILGPTIFLNLNTVQKELLYAFYGLGFMPCIIGYDWQLLRELRTKSYATTAPNWESSKILQYWIEGARAIPICFLILIIPFIALQKADSSMGLLSCPNNTNIVLSVVLAFTVFIPIALAAIVQSSTGRYVAIFNASRTLKAVLKCYFPALVVSAFIAALVYLLPTLVIVFYALGKFEALAFGPPLIIMLTMIFHFTAQAFDGYQD